MKEAATRFSTEALVLKEKEIGESDRLVTLFTRDYGIIRAFASGAKKINSKKNSSTSALVYSNFSLIKRGDTYKIYEAQPIRVFFEVGTSIETLALSQYFCELALKLIPDGTVNEDFLRLILNSLHFLAKGDKNLHIIKAVTELRAASLCGFAPDLIACRECAKFEDKTMFFDLINGAIYCSTCNFSKESLPINKTVLSAMRHIVFSEFSNIYSFSVPEKEAIALSKVTEKYIATQSDFKFLTLDFFNTLKES